MHRSNMLLRVSICYCCVAFCSRSLLGLSDATPSIRYLDKVSDTIVVGEVSDVSATGTVVLTTVRIIKGALQAGTHLTLALPVCSAETTDGSKYGVWFLSRDDIGQYKFAISPKAQTCPSVSSIISMPAGSLPSEWMYSSSLSPRDKLAQELGYSIFTHEGDGPKALLLNVDVFQGASVDTCRRIMRQLASGNTISLQMLSLTTLIESGDPVSIRALHSRWQEMSTKPYRSSVSTSDGRMPVSYGPDGISHPSWRSSLLNSLSRVMTVNPETISAVGSIAVDTNQDVSLRQAAAHALRQIHNPQALVFLASLFTDDDRTLRDAAISGIACFANGIPPIAIDNGPHAFDLNQPSPFKSADTLEHFVFGQDNISEREHYYFEYWRQWWVTNSASIIASN